MKGILAKTIHVIGWIWIILFFLSGLILAGIFGLEYLKPGIFTAQVNQWKSEKIVAQKSIISDPNILHEKHIEYEPKTAFSELPTRNMTKYTGRGLYLRGVVNMPRTALHGSIHLPIYEGGSNYILKFGAGIAAPNRIMGKKGNNFPIFGHNMGTYNNANPTYFSAMQTMNQNINGEPVYTTDGAYIYTWKIDSYMPRVYRTNIAVLNNDYAFPNQRYTSQQKARITMATCLEDAAWRQQYHNTGRASANYRIIISGYLQKKEPFNEAQAYKRNMFPEIKTSYQGKTSYSKHQDIYNIHTNHQKTQISNHKQVVLHSVKSPVSKWQNVIIWSSDHLVSVLIIWFSIFIAGILLENLTLFLLR